MPETAASGGTVAIRVNGRPVTVPAGTTVAVALMQQGIGGFRRSVTGEPRGPLCGMGVCFECRVTLDGQPHQRSCQRPCEPGMEVETDDWVTARAQGAKDEGTAPRGVVSRTVSAETTGTNERRPPALTRPRVRRFDAIVVGAGPAGIAAACCAAEAGRRVVLLDDNPAPGGQLWRGADRERPAGEAGGWLVRLRAAKVEVQCGASAIGAGREGGLIVEQRGEIEAFSAPVIVLATGARELFLPFPGWREPGVLGAGGLQALVKSGLSVAGQTVVVAGSGPLLLAVAAYLKSRGAHVPFVAEQADQASVLKFGFGLVTRPGKLVEALALRWRLRGVPYLHGCAPSWVSAHEGRLRVSFRGLVLDRSCDYLACGFGLVPNTELAELLGCEMARHVVRVDEFQRTSRPGIYSAGETGGIGGLDAALAEGRIAGYAAAGREDLARRWFPARSRARKFAAALERAFALRPELKSIGTEHTLVCRCEDVTLGRAMECRSWKSAKLLTRCGMGPCQGRVCGPGLEYLLGWEVKSVRPPVFPTAVANLARWGLADEANDPDGLTLEGGCEPPPADRAT